MTPEERQRLIDQLKAENAEIEDALSMSPLGGKSFASRGQKARDKAEAERLARLEELGMDQPIGSGLPDYGDPNAPIDEDALAAAREQHGDDFDKLFTGKFSSTGKPILSGDALADVSYDAYKELPKPERQRIRAKTSENAGLASPIRDQLAEESERTRLQGKSRPGRMAEVAIRRAADSILLGQGDEVAGLAARLRGDDPEAAKKSVRIQKRAGHKEAEGASIAGDLAGFLVPGSVAFKFADKALKTLKYVPGASTAGRVLTPTGPGMGKRLARYFSVPIPRAMAAGGADGYMYGFTIGADFEEAMLGREITSEDRQRIAGRDAAVGMLVGGALSPIWRGLRFGGTAIGDAFNGTPDNLRPQSVADRFTPRSRRAEVAETELRYQGFSNDQINLVRDLVEKGDAEGAQEVLASAYNQALMMVEKRFQADGVSPQAVYDKIQELTYKKGAGEGAGTSGTPAAGEMLFELVNLINKGAKTDQLVVALSTVSGPTRRSLGKRFQGRDRAELREIRRNLADATGMRAVDYIDDVKALDDIAAEQSHELYEDSFARELSDDTWSAMTAKSGPLDESLLDEDAFVEAIPQAMKNLRAVAKTEPEKLAVREMREFIDAIDAGDIPAKPSVRIIKALDEVLTDTINDNSSSGNKKANRSVGATQQKLRSLTDEDTQLKLARDKYSEFATAKEALEATVKMFDNTTELEDIFLEFRRFMGGKDDVGSLVVKEAILRGFVKGADRALKKSQTTTQGTRKMVGTDTTEEKLREMLRIAREELNQGGKKGNITQGQTELMGGKRQVTYEDLFEGDKVTRTEKNVEIPGRLERAQTMGENRRRLYGGSETEPRRQAVEGEDLMSSEQVDWVTSLIQGPTSFAAKTVREVSNRARRSGIYNDEVNEQLGNILLAQGDDIPKTLRDIERVRRARREGDIAPPDRPSRSTPSFAPLTNDSTADTAEAGRAALDQAKRMEGDKVNAGDIRAQTGWYRGLAGDWRQERAGNAQPRTRSAIEQRFPTLASMRDAADDAVQQATTFWRTIVSNGDIGVVGEAAERLRVTLNDLQHNTQQAERLVATGDAQSLRQGANAARAAADRARALRDIVEAAGDLEPTSAGYRANITNILSSNPNPPDLNEVDAMMQAYREAGRPADFVENINRAADTAEKSELFYEGANFQRYADALENDVEMQELDNLRTSRELGEDIQASNDRWNSEGLARDLRDLQDRRQVLRDRGVPEDNAQITSITAEIEKLFDDHAVYVRENLPAARRVEELSRSLADRDIPLDQPTKFMTKDGTYLNLNDADELTDGRSGLSSGERRDGLPIEDEMTDQTAIATMPFRNEVQARRIEEMLMTGVARDEIAEKMLTTPDVVAAVAFKARQRGLEIPTLRADNPERTMQAYAHRLRVEQGLDAETALVRMNARFPDAKLTKQELANMVATERRMIAAESSFTAPDTEAGFIDIFVDMKKLKRKRRRAQRKADAAHAAEVAKRAEVMRSAAFAKDPTNPQWVADMLKDFDFDLKHMARSMDAKSGPLHGALWDAVSPNQRIELATVLARYAPDRLKAYLDSPAARKSAKQAQEEITQRYEQTKRATYSVYRSAVQDMKKLAGKRVLNTDDWAAFQAILEDLVVVREPSDPRPFDHTTAMRLMKRLKGQYDAGRNRAERSKRMSAASMATMNKEGLWNSFYTIEPLPSGQMPGDGILRNAYDTVGRRAAENISGAEREFGDMLFDAVLDRGSGRAIWSRTEELDALMARLPDYSALADSRINLEAVLVDGAKILGLVALTGAGAGGYKVLMTMREKRRDSADEGLGPESLSGFRPQPRGGIQKMNRSQPRTRVSIGGAVQTIELGSVLSPRARPKISSGSLPGPLPTGTETKVAKPRPVARRFRPNIQNL